MHPAQALANLYSDTHAALRPNSPMARRAAALYFTLTDAETGTLLPPLSWFQVRRLGSQFLNALDWADVADEVGAEQLHRDSGVFFQTLETSKRRAP